MKKLIIIFLSSFICAFAGAQIHSFQKLYRTTFFTHCYDIAPTQDRGYLVTGFEDRPAPSTVPLVPYLLKMDCEGEILWFRKYGEAVTAGNVDPRVDTLHDGDLVLSTTIQGNANDILIVKTDAGGNAIWKRAYGGGFNDVALGLTVLSDSNIVVCGSSESYGSDVGGIFRDAYVLKIDDLTGDTLWTRTLGNPGVIDEAWDAVENDSGGVTVVGRTFHGGAFRIIVYYLDDDGTLLWKNSYGEANHSSLGMHIERIGSGYVFTGFTTLAKTDFNSPVDVPVIRIDSTGGIVWARIYHGSSPDNSDVGSSIAISNDTLAVAVESSSYPDTSVDVTKRCLYLINANDGTLLNAKYFNGSGGQFPMIYKDYRGFVMSGMTDEFEGDWSDPIITKLDPDFNSGCEETDVTPQTITENVTWQETDTSYTITTGVSIAIYTPDSTGALYIDSTICMDRTFPTISFDWDVEECLEDSVMFTIEISNPDYISRRFFFGDQTNSSSDADTLYHDYEDVGNYQAVLEVEYCDSTYEISQTVELPDCDSIIAPNVFTPNGDGMNDVWLPDARGVRSFEAHIYDRWGRELFVTNDITQGWDGMVNGIEAKEGVYFWIIEAVFSAGERRFHKSGNVTLMR